MRRFALAGVLVLASCDRLLGLEPLTPKPDGPPPTTVTGVIRAAYADNTATGTTVVDTAYDAGGVQLQLELPDGTAQPVAYQADGTFAFGVAAQGDRYRLRVSSIDGVTEYQLAAPQLFLQSRTAGRPDRVPVTLKTAIDFTISNAITTDTYVMTTGLWTNTYVGQTATQTFAYSSAVSINGPLGLLDAAQHHDRLYVEQWQYSSSGTNMYDTIVSVANADVTLADGGSTAVTAALAPLTRDLCEHVTADLGDDYARLSAATQRIYGTVGTSWGLYSAPSALQTGTAGALPLVGGGGGTSDYDVSPVFGNPFPDTDLLAVSGVSAAHTSVPPVGTPIVVYDGVNTNAQIDGAGCPTSSVALHSMIGLPGQPVLASTALASEGMIVAIDPSQPVPLTWSVIADGPVDYYAVALVEIAGGTTVARQSIITDQPSVVLDPSSFAVGHAYAIAISSYHGYPGAPSGDFSTLGYPLESADTWSPAFGVSLAGR